MVEGAAYANRRALFLLAELAAEGPAREPAIAALLPYLERNLDPELHFAVAAKLGVGLGRSGRYAEALRAYEIAAQFAPRDPDVQRGLASARRLLAKDTAPRRRLPAHRLISRRLSADPDLRRRASQNDTSITIQRGSPGLRPRSWARRRRGRLDPQPRVLPGDRRAQVELARRHDGGGKDPTLACHTE